MTYRVVPLQARYGGNAGCSQLRSLALLLPRALKVAISNGTLVAVSGLGYVGLQRAVEFGKKVQNYRILFFRSQDR